MPTLDMEKLQQRKADQQRRQTEAIAWGTQALAEFESAAGILETPLRGDPEYLKIVLKSDRLPVWPILRVYREDNDWLFGTCYGVVMNRAGTLWAAAEEADLPTASAWIAARCGYSIGLMGSVIEDALLGDPWDDREALKLAPSSRAAR